MYSYVTALTEIPCVIMHYNSKLILRQLDRVVHELRQLDRVVHK
jgi:hypothetical protein